MLARTHSLGGPWGIWRFLPALRSLTGPTRPSNVEVMGFEVEVKYRSVDHDVLQRRLAELGAVPAASVLQVDTYLSHPARDLTATNEAFRVRSTGGENRITYKGPRRPGPTKTREEIEVRFADGEQSAGQLLRLFEILGFRPLATIRKKRTSFHLTVDHHNLDVALDQAEGLGHFAEIETLAASEAELKAAQATVLALAAELGLAEVELRSYLRMALESREGIELGKKENHD